ncbi:hypothetical protein KXQ82_00540 [Mucilaginibacter sp. HMF5004]|uniref:anti-phage dCTP deaminase n=1 Tax=Mucilaginibacter rivuli TaxID=2857527 RepID=UPI001C5D467E|nr:anti-phage dCTP deaminase [Mucilaginibacter rivuli]MBW4888174.1 hypothetical protein [Mucilaginibacter rivuli]
MNEAAVQLKLSTSYQSGDEETYKEIKELLKDTHSEELIITLCGFIGTDIHGVSKKLKLILENVFSYEVEIINLSTYIKKHSKEAKDLNREGVTYYEYIKKLIDGGNELRLSHRSSILAELCIQKIAFDRHKNRDDKKESAFKTRRKCYIIDSIKNLDELELFRIVYRDIHYSIGIFSPIHIRKRHLADLEQMKESDIDKLIDRDSGEEISHGQKVRDTFIQSDFFLRLDTFVGDAIEKRLERYLHLIFGSKVVTPTPDETAMYQASCAAGNSACLSRQVGAALTDKLGEILSVGWNDVPKFKGGLYQTDNHDPLGESDSRCFNVGRGCWNDQEKNIIATELVDILMKSQLIQEAQRVDFLKAIKKSKIKGLVEFSRAIHAEMHAIITGSQIAGEKVRGGSLYITTYPCHNCARHIIVAGIEKVYYIEPYRKSLTTKLHFDAITENEQEKDKVLILMYDGVAPTRFMELFKMTPNSRKSNNGDGRPIDYDFKKAKPKSTLSLEAIPVLEFKIAEELKKEGLEIQ